MCSLTHELHFSVSPVDVSLSMLSSPKLQSPTTPQFCWSRLFTPGANILNGHNIKAGQLQQGVRRKQETRKQETVQTHFWFLFLFTVISPRVQFHFQAVPGYLVNCRPPNCSSAASSIHPSGSSTAFLQAPSTSRLGSAWPVQRSTCFAPSLLWSLNPHDCRARLYLPAYLGKEHHPIPPKFRPPCINANQHATATRTAITRAD